MKPLSQILAILSLLILLPGCFSIPDGDPPDGPIFNIDFGKEILTQEQATEAMITKLSAAMLQANISEKRIPVQYNCSGKIKKMSQSVFNDVGGMLNFTVHAAQKEETKLMFKCRQQNKKEQTFWFISCQRGSEKIFNIGVKISNLNSPGSKKP